MAYDQTSICNLALQQFGADTIVSINGSDNSAVICKSFYEHSLREILAMAPWGFATKRASLTQSATTPAFEYSYQYPLPDDYVHVLEINGKNPYSVAQQEFVIEDNHVLSNSSTAEIRYVFYNDTPSDYSADFVEAFALLLATKIAPKISGNAQTVQGLVTKFEGIARGRALLQHGNESRRQRVNRVLDSPLVQARARSGFQVTSDP